jgi:hypothetical protein
MQAPRLRGVYLLLFLDLGTKWDEWSASRPGRPLTAGKGLPRTHWIGGCVGLRADLDTEARGKILGFCRGSNPSRIVCNHTLTVFLLFTIILLFHHLLFFQDTDGL